MLEGFLRIINPLLSHLTKTCGWRLTGGHPGCRDVNGFVGRGAVSGFRCSTVILAGCLLVSSAQPGFSQEKKPRVLVTSDGEIDDECSMVRFLLYANEWDIEGIITSSSQYHWQGHKWAGDDWVEPYLDAYAKVLPNLIKHDPGYPTADFLRARTLLGNVKSEGDMEEPTDGSNRIVDVLLDASDPRPVWIQAWGGTNTIARALKTIEDEHPERMREAAGKCRFFFIWEQDSTYQDYIRPVWGKYGIPTIISDQFIAYFYLWKEYLPSEQQNVLSGSWMKPNILDGHGPLCALYKAHGKGEQGFDEGDFRSEGDSPTFLHTIPTGLRSMESPDWGGWGGRYVKVRENTWLDHVAEPGYEYPIGRWYTSNAWGRQRLKKGIPNDAELVNYLKPMWRWTEAVQNDFASRADWCVKPFAEANHPPVVKLDHPRNLKVAAGETVQLGAMGSSDPDGDPLDYKWWIYGEAGTYPGTIKIPGSGNQTTELSLPDDFRKGMSIHVICEVTDRGTPPLTRYQRVVLRAE
nr:nucleoside hydrolase-like domain-containing protein [Haloferula luteola]